MGRKYKIRDQEGLYFVTFTIVHWLDVFVRDDYKQIFVDSLNYCQDKKGLEVYAWVIMTSHVHLILRSNGNLSDTIRDMKSHTSLALRKCIQDNPRESRKEFLLWMFERTAKKNKRNTKYQVWQQHNHPIELSTKEMVDQRLNYIHNNPVEAGFVLEAESWHWGSARDYIKEEKGYVDLCFV